MASVRFTTFRVMVLPFMPNYEDVLILGYAGLKVGERVTIPGDDITNAVKNLMRQSK